jgi:hypothetical protein
MLDLSMAAIFGRIYDFILNSFLKIALLFLQMLANIRRNFLLRSLMILLIIVDENQVFKGLRDHKFYFDNSSFLSTHKKQNKQQLQTIKNNNKKNPQHKMFRRFIMFLFHNVC